MVYNCYESVKENKSHRIADTGASSSKEINPLTTFYCEKCGKLNQFFHKYCHFCGAYLEQAKKLFEYIIYSDSEQSTPRYISKKVRKAVWMRDRGRCVECGSSRDLEFDHIIPVSKGGSNDAKNVQILCAKCNRKKSNKIDG